MLCFTLSTYFDSEILTLLLIEILTLLFYVETCILYLYILDVVQMWLATFGMVLNISCPSATVCFRFPLSSNVSRKPQYSFPCQTPKTVSTISAKNLNASCTSHVPKFMQICPELIVITLKLQVHIN